MLKPGGILETGVPAPLFHTRINALPWADQYCVTGDGQRFLVIEPPDKPSLINLPLNWPAALQN